MEKVKYHSRSIFDLTNREIVRLVDFIIDQTNLDRIAHSLYKERESLSRNITYRKIEIKYAYYDWAYAVVVTLRFSNLDRDVKTGFILFCEGGGANENQLFETDFQISSIKGFFEPFHDVVLPDLDVEDEYKIEFDYSHLTIYTKKLYNFLENDLRMWSPYLTIDTYANNPQLIGLYQKDQPSSFVVEELEESSNKEKLVLLSK